MPGAIGEETNFEKTHAPPRRRASGGFMANARHGAIDEACTPLRPNARHGAMDEACTPLRPNARHGAIDEASTPLRPNALTASLSWAAAGLAALPDCCCRWRPRCCCCLRLRRRYTYR